jgi:type IV secretory pathway VirB10-like protein
MTDEADSPDELQPDAGVRRLNKKPLIIVATILTAAIIVLVWGISAKKRHANAKAGTIATSRREPDKEEAAALQKDAPPAGPISESAPDLEHGMESGLIPAALTAAQSIDKAAGLGKGGPDGRSAADDRRETMLETAMNAPSRVAGVDDLLRSEKAAEAPSPPIAAPVPAQSRTAGPAPALAAGGDDPNLQGRKESFAQGPNETGYLGNVKQQPISPYELKAGTIIPAIMVSGIDSDLPGQIVAQVSQNVYDTKTGDYLLIPQGAKLVGVYDSRVAVGQERVQVIWNRLNFPDGSTLALGNMEGADEGGYTGLEDKVNNHLARIFGDSITLSLLSAGAQLSQPQNTSVNGAPTAGQTVAAAMGQQFAATGSEITKRNMQIQPTLEIRPGFRFNVMINKDVVLDPYKVE